MDFFVVTEIGATRSLTPEGYLVCRDVAIARTGQQEYLATELGGKVTGDSRGIVTIQRDADEVFRPETVASFAGKPIVMSYHQMLDPRTWRGRTAGTILNPRRVTNAAGDLLVADLMICDAEAIRMITDGATTEVSCGYTADYEETAPGHGRQINIIGNHLAVVERGRCGPVCAIGDSSMATTPRKKTWLDRIREKIRTGDSEGAEELLAEMAPEAAEAGGLPNITINMPGAAPAATEKTGDEEGAATQPTLADLMAAINAIGERVGKLEAGEKAEAAANGAATGDEETEEEKKKREEEEAAAGATGDSAALVQAFQEAVSGAEIIAPGIRLPTFDAKARPGATNTAICTLRRNAMATFLATQPGATWGDSLGVKATHLDGMTCDAIAGLFPVAVRDRKAGTQPGRHGGMTFPTGDQAASYKPRTPAEINAANRKAFGFV